MVIYIARISEAASYLSDDPKACINCHIMAPEYATWQHSSHARVTNCNDCHVPHTSLAAKYYFKAKDGMRHSTLFTLRLEPQVIQTTEASRQVIEGNCRRCHSDLIEGVTDAVHSGSDRACMDCHREVPHGRVHSLSSTPNAAIPPQAPVTPEWFLKALQGEKQSP
jgi:cytochrome c nitrite reductase small subunit